MTNKFKKAVEQRISEEEFIETAANENSKKGDTNDLKNENDDKGNDKNNEIQDIENIDYSIINILETKGDKKAKNKTYYLDESVIKAVAQISKKKKMSESKVANDILKHILKIK